MPNPVQTNNQKSVDIQSILNRKTSAMPKGIKVIKKGETGLDKNSFLKILLTQLQHQDPLKPQQDKDFIAQMAQFSALEQMKNVASEVKSLKKFQANFLVGKTISGRDFVSGKVVSGEVKSVIYDATGQVFLRVNGRSVKMDALTSVKNTVSSVNPNRPRQYRPSAKYAKPPSAQRNNVSRETITSLKSKAYKPPANQTNNQAKKAYDINHNNSKTETKQVHIQQKVKGK